jgi:hypothetical protein
MEGSNGKNNEELAKRKKINLIIIGVGVVAMVIIFPIAGSLGKKSVTDLNSYGVYSLYASENEKDGSITNRVEYYVCNGDFDLNTLVELCKKKKDIYKSSTTFAGYYMVVFNNKNNVYKSKHPIGAMYGDETDNLRNILAFYTFGGLRGISFSQIQYYDKNAAESLARTFNVN